MINKELIKPQSIVIVGGSDDLEKPGGAALKNLIDNKYQGKLYVVNPKYEEVQKVKSFKKIEELPQVDLAILAIPAHLCSDAAQTLCKYKNCRAIIVYSAGFSEFGEIGSNYESDLGMIVKKHSCSLIGPNCIGVMNKFYSGVFTKPIPRFEDRGIDIVSGSGATVVFIIENAIKLGLSFSSVYSVGNSTIIGVEEVLEFWDESFVEGESSNVKLLYIESIKNPNKFLKHSLSLAKKGVKIAAIKAGYSEAGSRAASSHTGALSTPDTIIEALFKKAGIIRCYSRNELVNVAAVLMNKIPKGNKVAIITHAGGPAVILTDLLSSEGLLIPNFHGKKADELLSSLFVGSSVKNPIDFLATGTAEQLQLIIKTVASDFEVDSIAVIFGSPGLSNVSTVYKVIRESQNQVKIPIFPIFPSIVNASKEIEEFHSLGGISFHDEADFARAFSKVITNHPHISQESLPPVDLKMIRKIISESGDGYLNPNKVKMLLDAAGITRAEEIVSDNLEIISESAKRIGFPIVMKVVGPIHKTDVGGVSLNITDDETVITEFKRMMNIKGTTGVLIQPMLSGEQLFVGAKREDNFGHIIMCGLGGIMIEVLKDFSTSLSPISIKDAEEMILKLRGFPIIKGVRGREGVNIALFIEVIRRVSALCKAAPEIYEMDLNPIMGNTKNLVAVDSRIKISKTN